VPLVRHSDRCPVRLPALLVLAWMMVCAGPVLAAAPVAGGDAGRVQLEVELVGDGMPGERRVLDLDLSEASEPRSGSWLGVAGGLIAGVGLLPMLWWLGRRVPRPAFGSR
jgi:hypothetical protein